MMEKPYMSINHTRQVADAEGQTQNYPNKYHLNGSFKMTKDETSLI